jgi:hypothetical protein
MLEIVYASVAVESFAEAQLATMLGRARINNTRLAVTGMLVHDRGTFLQVLEGEATPTRALFEKISKDPRHHRLVRISETEITTRSFDQWSMGFVGLNASTRQHLKDLPGLFASDFSFASMFSGAGYQHARAFLLALRQDRFRIPVEA